MRRRTAAPYVRSTWRSQVPRPMLRNTEEKKFTDTNSDALSSTTFVAFPICAPQPGTGRSARVGDRVYIMYMQARFGIEIGTTSPANIRIVLMVDKQPNGIAVTSAELFENTLQATYSQFNAAYRNRFTILRDKRLNLNTAQRPTLVWKMYKKIGIESFLSGSAGSAADYRTNGLYLVMFSDVAPASNPPTVRMYLRVHYRDA